MRRTAKKRGYSKERTNSYVYGSPIMKKYFKEKRKGKGRKHK